MSFASTQTALERIQYPNQSEQHVCLGLGWEPLYVTKQFALNTKWPTTERRHVTLITHTTTLNPILWLFFGVKMFLLTVGFPLFPKAGCLDTQTSCLFFLQGPYVCPANGECLGETCTFRFVKRNWCKLSTGRSGSIPNMPAVP